MKKSITIEQLNLLSIGRIEAFTSFNSILIVIDDGSQPERLMWFLKTLTEYEAHQLLAVTDHEGTISFFWDRTPPRFVNLQDIEIPDGDNWSIFKTYELDANNRMKEIVKEEL